MKRITNASLLYLIVFCSQLCGQTWREDKYIDIDVLGWKVRVNAKLIEGDTSLLKKSLGLFGKELNEITKVLPDHLLTQLRKVTFWFEKETTIHGYTGMYFHQGNGPYLRAHNANPAKAGGIEIVAGRYIDAKVAKEEDWVILHELAHAYHLTVLKYDEKIQKIFKVIQRAGLYANVRRDFDNHHHGYALTNYFEYFAEITTMYFGRNSYYPFDRADLKNYDPLGYKLVQEMWEVGDK